MKHLILVDSTQAANAPTQLVVNWSELHPPSPQVSLPQLTQERSTLTKTEFLQWTHDFANAPIGARSIKNGLKIKSGFSLWWLTLISEKCPLRSTVFYQIFKLRTLEAFYLENQCEGLTYRGNDRQLAAVLMGFCKNMGHSFHHEHLKEDRARTSEKKSALRDFFYRTPHFFRAMSYFFRAIWQSLLCKSILSKPRFHKQKNAITVVSYFPNIDAKKAEKNIFHSRYWGDFHSLVETKKIPINWIWIYAKSNQTSFRQTINYAKAFGKNSSDQSFTVFEQFQNPGTFFKTFYLYLKMAFKNRRYLKDHGKSRLAQSKMNFHAYISNDLKSSIYGINAMSGLLYLAGFEKMAKTLCGENKNKLLYLWENQAWEHCLMNAWKNNKGGPAIAHQHATIRPMDLRSFFHPDDYKDPSLPLPDFLAVNGSYSLNQFIQSQFPDTRLVATEALRYNFLHQIKNQPAKIKTSERRTLLVLTGYVDQENKYQLELLNRAFAGGGLRNFKRILFKPHPFCPIEKHWELLPDQLRGELVRSPLTELFGSEPVVYCDNTTSAAVESAMFGLPTITLQAFNNLNLSPIFGLADVHFVASDQDLITALANSQKIQIDQDYFYTSDNLTAWQNVLTS